MKKTLLFLLSFSLIVAASAASADDLKIKIVDMQQILQKAPQIGEINKQLTKQFKPRQDKIVAEQKALQGEMGKLNKDSTVMTEKDRSALQDKIVKDRANLQSTIVAFQRDLSAVQNQELQKFNRELNTVIQDLAKKNQLDLVLQRASVLYQKESAGFDMTQQVLAGLHGNKS